MPRRSAPRWLGRRTVALAAPVLLLLAGTACQVTLVAGVDARADGTGFVRAAIGLDGEALRELGDPDWELRLDDLRQAGWDVSEPRQEGDGLTWVRASKPFATAAEAGQVASELSGPDGPFREFRLERTRSFLKTRTTFTGLVDLSKGLSGLSDPDLQERLGDADLELDPDGLQRRFGDDVDKSVRVRVEAKLPGDVEAEGSSSIGGGVAWQPAVGEQARLHAVAEAWNLQPLVPAVAALAFATAAVVLVMRRRA